MICPKVDDIVLYLDGELSVNRSRELAQHLPECPACTRAHDELRRMIQRIGRAEEVVEDAELVRETLRSVPLPLRASPAEAPPRRSRAAVWLPLAALAAAGFAGVLLLSPALRRAGDTGRGGSTIERPAFTSRGGTTEEERRWFSLWVFRRNDGGAGYEEVKQEIAADSYLVFGYVSLVQAYPYLMIFAVDQRGEIHWYYPAYEERRKDPESILIQKGRHELRDEIQHDLPDGMLRIVAVFSKQPLRVSQVERQIKEELARRPDLLSLERLPLPETAQVSRLLRVRRTLDAGPRP